MKKTAHYDVMVITVMTSLALNSDNQPPTLGPSTRSITMDVTMATEARGNSKLHFKNNFIINKIKLLIEWVVG